MRHMTKTILIVGLLFASNAWSARDFITANVDRLLTTDDDFGGCMAKLDEAIGSTGLDCRGTWVTFSCSGDFTSRQDAKINFEMVQLAFAMGNQITVVADDSRKHNDFCFSARVYVLP